MNFVDLNKYIEEREKMTIDEILEFRGENFLHNLEIKLLSDNTFSNSLITLRYKTPKGNMEFLNKIGITVYLKVPLDVISFRLLNKFENGNLTKYFSKLNSATKIFYAVKDSFSILSPFYEQANIISDGKYFKGLTQDLSENLGEFIN